MECDLINYINYINREKSPPAPAPSSSSLAKFTNSPADINICDNNTNHLLNVDSKGIIRRVSNGVKDRVRNLLNRIPLFHSGLQKTHGLVCYRYLASLTPLKVTQNL